MVIQVLVVHGVVVVVQVFLTLVGGGEEGGLDVVRVCAEGGDGYLLFVRRGGGRLLGDEGGAFHGGEGVVGRFLVGG